MIVMVSRKDILGQAFEAARERGGGLTASEMAHVVGGNWSRWLGELEADGWVFREDPSRFGRPQRTFRWVLLYVPAAEVVETVEAEQLTLLDARAGARPASPVGTTA